MTMNPYLSFAMTMAASLSGIRDKIDPGPPTETSLYDTSPEELRRAGRSRLPRTLADAVDAFDADPLAKESTRAGHARELQSLQARRVEPLQRTGHALGAGGVPAPVLTKKQRFVLPGDASDQRQARETGHGIPFRFFVSRTP